jgi:hypothetical protein
MRQVHNVHHPVSVNFYYEDQKAEAIRAAEQFRATRLAKFFQHFQSVLETNPENKGDKGTVFNLSTHCETSDSDSVDVTKKVPSCFQISLQLPTLLCSTI